MNFDHPKLTGERTIQNAIMEVAAMMGENVKLGGGFALSAPSQGVLSTYLHLSPQPGTWFQSYNGDIENSFIHVIFHMWGTGSASFQIS